MSYTKIKYILFDVGNVLVYKKTHEDENVANLLNLTRQEYRQLLDDVIESQTDREKKQFRDINTVDKEFLYLQSLHKKICKTIGRKPTKKLIEQMTTYRMKGDFALKDNVINTLIKLSKSFTLGILSNALPSRRIHELKIDNLDMFFKHIFISHEISMWKPDQNIYEYVIKEIGLNKDEILFVDDKLEYLEGAEKAGITNLVMIENKDKTDKYPVIQDIQELTKILNIN